MSRDVNEGIHSPQNVPSFSKGRKGVTKASAKEHPASDRVLPHASGSDSDPERQQDIQIQPRPSEFPNLAVEIVCVLACSAGQFLWALSLGNVHINQLVLVNDFGIPGSKTPWLVGSLLVANGVSVSICGSLMDLVPPRPFVLAAFAWLTVWNLIGALTTSTSAHWPLFLVIRVMQGLALGALLSGSFSILGRLYKPGLRKTRVFSLMACFPPLGLPIGLLQGGALTKHQAWIFGSTAVLTGICASAAFFSIPSLRPARAGKSSRELSIRDFDIFGASFLIIANILILFGVTQGSTDRWAPYTYSLAIVGFLFLGAFFFLERYVSRPLVPPQLWSTKSFTPLIVSFAFSFGSWLGAWQPYAIQYFLFIRHSTPFQTALYWIPNALVGIVAVYVVQFTLHHCSSHWIFSISMLACAVSPALFLPLTPRTSYWALAMPGIGIGTFGPDMSFVTASIFITSSVPRSYQGAAGSLLITIENLSAAVFVAVAGAIGTALNDGHGVHSVDDQGEGSDQGPGANLRGLKACWWLGMSSSIFAAALIAATVRIKKAGESEHVAEEQSDTNPGRE